MVSSAEYDAIIKDIFLDSDTDMVDRTKRELGERGRHHAPVCSSAISVNASRSVT